MAPKANRDARAVVLMYHRVGDVHNSWEARYAITPSDFAAHMDTLARSGWHAVPMDRFVEWLEGGQPLPPKSFLLTFDDGFRGVREHALPVLERLGWPCTIFLVSGLIGGRDEWTSDQNPDSTTYPLLDLDEIRDMQARGVTFHSHTQSHPSLPALDDSKLAEELTVSRSVLRSLLQCGACYFAYPFGHLDDRVESAVRDAGYRAAFSTQPGFNSLSVNRFRIRRLDIFGTDTPAMLLRKMRLGTNDGSLYQTVRYYLNRLWHRMARSTH